MSEEIKALLAAVDQIKQAFGAPGDYGYERKEGQALYALYKAAAAVPKQPA